MLVTAGAFFALAIVIALGPDGPARLWLDGGGSTVTLKPRESNTNAVTLPDGPAALLPGALNTGLVSGVRLGSPIAAAERPGAVQLRADTRVQRRTVARTPSVRRPTTPAPASTPSPLQPVSQSTSSTPAPVATSAPAPGSTVVKSRGRGTSPAKPEVPKQRVQKQAASPAPTAAPPASATPGPAPRSSAPAPAPAPTLRPVHGGGQPSTGVGAADGVLHRVPPTRP